MPLPLPVLTSDGPPPGLPVYRLLTGKDDASFCHRVSEALALGYVLHGSPALTFNGTDVIAAQALLWSPGRAAAQSGTVEPPAGP